jgi:hypothetical protein
LDQQCDGLFPKGIRFSYRKRLHQRVIIALEALHLHVQFIGEPRVPRDASRQKVLVSERLEFVRAPESTFSSLRDPFGHAALGGFVRTQAP